METPGTTIPIVLASASPRRSELLSMLGLVFEVQPSEVPEYQLTGEEPEQMASRLSELKALAAVPCSHPIIVAADTIVVFENQVLGKPNSPQQACDMLTRLRAREHSVITGLTILNDSDNTSCLQIAITTVMMRDYSDHEIEEYIATGDPMDKAGAYAIQNAIFNPVAGIMGCYTNVIGLPVCHLYRAMIQMKVEIPKHPLSCCPWAAQFGCICAKPILDTRVQIKSLEPAGNRSVQLAFPG